MSEPTAPTPASHDAAHPPDAPTAASTRAPGWIERTLRVASPPLHRRWLRLDRHHQRWIGAMVLGIAIEFVLHLGGHVWHWDWLTVAQNSALDRMMRLDAVLRARPEPGLPSYAFIDVDDETHRAAAWGGGEPVQAPRDALLRLVRQSFAAGARQVVLDVVVEDSAVRSGNEEPLVAALRAEDQRFADGLRTLLDDANFPPDRQLVLVRTLRIPLPGGGGHAVAPSPRNTGAVLPALRRAGAVDAVVAASGGRIVLAAPYFEYSPDRVLRDWQLFQVVCLDDPAAPGSGRLQVVPSVQLATVAHHFGVPSAAVSGARLAAAACVPAGEGNAGPIGPGVAANTAAVVRDFGETYWEGLRAAYAQSPACRETPRCRDARLPPLSRLDSLLANRILFRVTVDGRAPASPVPLATRVTALDVLADDARGSPAPARRALLDGRIVVIGQSHAEARDAHLTPLGQMPGAVVLLNAIDSMARHQVLTAPSSTTTWAIALLLIAGVGWLFVHWDTIVAAYLGAVVVLVVAGVGSYLWFAHGVWLDFALPLVAVQMHRLIQMWEERIARWRRVGQLGAPAEH